MKTIEGEFDHFYFHDSIVKTILSAAGKITIELSFAHILGQHSQNQIEKTICVKDCQLIFSEVTESIAKVYSDEQKEWLMLQSPQTTDLLGDIVETEVVGHGQYKLSEMTTGSQWSEWLIKAGTEVGDRRRILVNKRISKKGKPTTNTAHSGYRTAMLQVQAGPGTECS
jgi:hypothetical protein